MSVGKTRHTRKADTLRLTGAADENNMIKGAWDKRKWCPLIDGCRAAGRREMGLKPGRDRGEGVGHRYLWYFLHSLHSLPLQ